MNCLGKDIHCVGVRDNSIDFFEGMYRVPDGVTYNSYLLADEKIAVIDSVDAAFRGEWLKNIAAALNGRTPDYLIVQHMEPDHSACVKAFAERYPSAKIVGNKKTFVMLEEYFGVGAFPNRLEVNDGGELACGKHTLKFIFAPMVHWPEVMFTYDETAKVLFSADAFGRFGMPENDEWDGEARRYYIGIVGKYGVQVKGALAKVASYPLTAVAPLHGPILCGEALSHALELYTKWSAYQPESERGTLIAYASVYGHTKAAAQLLASELEKRGEEVKLLDLVRDDWAECVAQAFKFPKLVIASTTYNADVFPAAREFIDRLTERNYQSRTVAFIENGTWAPVSAARMKARLEVCKNIVFAENSVKVRSALNAESEAKVVALAQELVGANEN